VVKPWLIESSRKLRLHFLFVASLLAMIWTVKIVEVSNGISLSRYGMLPRDPTHLPGILTMPMLHVDYEHLYANSVGVFILAMGLFAFYERVALRVLLHSWIWGGLLVWITARPNYHIGASGLVYSMIAFLVVSGVLRRDRASIGMMLITSLLYGSAVWGVLPIHPGISWEGHLCGAIAGAGLAWRYRKVDLPIEPETVSEEGDSARYIDPDAVDDVYRDPNAITETWADEEGDDLHFEDQMYENGRNRYRDRC